ncbi:hypothetical protein CMK11_21125 [Candidatus Poribacteria bacterium]|nr:hypothetical protein [Candidatus Poribacteria bacterium]
MKPRVDYDKIAHLYDDDAMRQKQPDADMLALADRTGRRIRALDIACGTGNQLAANRLVAPEHLYIGLDRHGEMIRRAASKDRAIGWVHGDGAQLPFRDGAFDYVSNQWAFHHVRDKVGMLRETHRVLARGGQFTMVNQEPRRMPDWPLYA